MVRDELAKQLRYYRELNNYTVYQVGDLVGKSGKTVSAWESGRGQPDADMLVSLCKLYNVRSISEFYGEKTDLGDALSKNESSLISNYRKLNDDGKKRLMERSEELISLGFTGSAKNKEEKLA